ncbi:MAG: hypothetical protein GWN00_32845, partial [Aliifodinibius sp.]|nr:hypothetical protein [Fodinibius sp.]NIV15553.1 hypothetical protein [Fodinibius sp.]NIY29406.1 hypothetical protein [Fodinibius sp.]
PESAMTLDGSGTEEDPWLIKSLEDFNEFAADANYWAGFTRLETDVNLAGRVYTTAVIAWDVNNTESLFQGTTFTGVFDGNNHTISNFSYTLTVTDYIGLFGYVYGENAEIRNLGVIDPNVDAGTGEYVSALVGWLHDGKITDCYVEGGSVKGYCYVGGMVGVVGYLWGDSDIGTVTNCYSYCTVSGYSWIGGLVGINCGTITNCNSNSGISGFHGIGGLIGCNYSGTISICYSTGSVAGDHRVGGLVGGNGGTITNSFARGGVSANEEVGGFVGYNGSLGTIPPPSLPMNRTKGQVSDISFAESTYTFQANNDVPIMSGYESLGEQDFYSATITNCYSTGTVEGLYEDGGLVAFGYASADRIINSYWDTETSGIDYSDGGIGLPTSQLKQQSTFTNWDFINVWNIGENQTYPYLRVYLPSDINKDGIVNFLDLSITANQWMQEK